MISSQRYHGPRVSRQGSGTGAAEPSVGSRHSQRVRDRTPSDWREPSMAKSEYGEGDYVVYPPPGAGGVLGVETLQVARKRVGQGKSVSVGVVLGGSRRLEK